MNELLLHACCGPCSTVAVPAWRERGVEPVAWFQNPNIQPAAELERRAESMRRYSRAASLCLVEERTIDAPDAWERWAQGQVALLPGDRCATCLGLRLRGAAAAAARLGVSRFSTTLTVSPYQRHDLIERAGAAAGEEHGVTFVYLDLRGSFRQSYGESRRLELYRQPYCGCAASKWDAWQARAERRKAG
jgi:predicted adenine nucleotide alpha hydrolase (AANH) superfamily ATPase